MRQWTEDSLAKCGDASRQAWADSRPAATSPEGILAETERLLAERAAGRSVRRRAYNVLVASGAMEWTEAEAAQFGRMLIDLMHENGRNE